MIPRTSQVERSPERETSRLYFPTDDVFDSTLKVLPPNGEKFGIKHVISKMLTLGVTPLFSLTLIATLL